MKKNSRLIVLLVMVFILLMLVSSCKKIELKEIDFKEINDYIDETSYIDFSFVKLMEKVNTQNDLLFIEKLNIAIDINGNINSININYYKKDSNTGYMLIYRKEANFFKVIENVEDNVDSFKENLNVLELVDNELKYIVKFEENHELFIIDLISPFEISNIFCSEDIDIFYNGGKVNIKNEDEINGITFHTYGAPINQEDKSIFYVFNEKSE